jgi:hypothetical protein
MTPTATLHPRLRLVPAPPLDPPFDDETPTPLPHVTGSLALAFPPATRDSVPLRLLPPAFPPGDAATPLPDAQLWARQFVQAIVEVLAGIRTAGQLSAHATLPVLDQLDAASGALAHSRGRRVPPRPVLRSLHVCRLPASAVEVCGVIDTGQRCRAIALRLVGVQGRWRCTALELG